MQMQINVRINVSPYFNSHGRLPRGRGGWIFCPVEHFNDGDYLNYCKNFNGTYAEAREQARKHFSEVGVREIAVCP